MMGVTGSIDELTGPAEAFVDEASMAAGPSLPADTLGDAVLLWESSRWNRRSPLVDGLVQELAGITQAVLEDQALSRFEDREITSAALSLGPLRQMRPQQQPPKNLGELVANRFSPRDGFFGNPLYTALIAIGLRQAGVQTAVDEGISRYLRDAVERSPDPKVRFFLGRALAEGKDTEALRLNASHASRELQKADLRFEDEVFLVVAAWDGEAGPDRSAVERVKSRSVALLNGFRDFAIAQEGGAIPPEFGRGSRVRVSKFLLAGIIELLGLAHRDLVVLSRSEIRQETGVRAGLIQGLVSLACLCGSAALVYASLFLPVGAAPPRLTVSTAEVTLAGALDVAGILLLAFAGISILYDTGWHGYPPRLVKKNLWKRIRDPLLIILIPVAAVAVSVLRPFI
jgi:hypothetical protein